MANQVPLDNSNNIYQVSEFIVHKFRKSLIKEEYGIKFEPKLLVNLTFNVILEIIHSVLGNLIRIYNIKGIYVDNNESWMGNLASTEFAIFSTANRLKVYTPHQQIF